mmetsp:Transcript_31112/g.81152  ORF Transcript_31112/g.81152 Transcript_31112/m.81152 type:complete len:125 (+) Transcript_31112:191-565(+)
MRDRDDAVDKTLSQRVLRTARTLSVPKPPPTLSWPSQSHSIQSFADSACVGVLRRVAPSPVATRQRNDHVGAPEQPPLCSRAAVAPSCANLKARPHLAARRACRNDLLSAIAGACVYCTQPLLF